MHKMLWFLLLVATLAYATKPYDLEQVYRNELRHLPEKLKQERIRVTINNTFTIIQYQVMRAAIRNETETNFTLFCTEPNHKSHLFRKKGSTYRFIDPDDSDYAWLTSPNYRASRYQDNKDPVIPKPHCSVKDGYELYNRYGGVGQPYQPDHPYYIPLDFTARNKPGIARGNLEQEPILYVQQFFQLFNHHFSDLTLVISHERKGEGIFETDCCPIYIVSW